MSDIYQDRKCISGGFLVSSSRYLGNPHEFHFGELGEVVGCSKLMCEYCDVKVVQVPNLTLKDTTTPAKTYSAWKEAPSNEHVDKDDGVRLYCCPCSCWVETSYTPTYSWEPFDYFNLVFPWRCQGHSPSSIAPEAGRASVYMLLEGEVGYPRFQNADLILRLWSSSNNDTRAAIAYTVTDALKNENRAVVLARALAVAWPVCGTGLTEILSQLDPNDARFNADDPTRSGWDLRQRLSDTIQREHEDY